MSLGVNSHDPAKRVVHCNKCSRKAYLDTTFPATLEDSRERVDQLLDELRGMSWDVSQWMRNTHYCPSCQAATPSAIISPMQAFLTGWLMMAVVGRGEEVMKIKKVDNRGTTDTFDITFESGLVLRVNVRVVN